MIDKTFRRKVLSYANGSAYIVTIPKEVKEGMTLSTEYVAQMEFKGNNEFVVKFKETASNQENIIERKVMSINEQLAFTIPTKHAKEMNIDDNTIIEMDGDIDKKEIIVHVNGKDMSEMEEVEKNE